MLHPSLTCADAVHMLALFVSINLCTYILDPFPHVRIQLKVHSVGSIRILGVAIVECLDIDCSYNMYEVLVIRYGEWIIITQ